MAKIKKLGNFKISTSIKVSDPCFESLDNCFPAKSGQWSAFILTNTDGIPTRLWARHVNTLISEEEIRAHVGYVPVDSAACGIFGDKYQPISWPEYPDEDVCANISENFVYARSGWGDGMYAIYTHTTDKLVDGVSIHFIPDAP